MGGHGSSPLGFFYPSWCRCNNLSWVVTVHLLWFFLIHPGVGVITCRGWSRFISFVFFNPSWCRCNNLSWVVSVHLLWFFLIHPGVGVITCRGWSRFISFVFLAMLETPFVLVFTFYVRTRKLRRQHIIDFSSSR